jgi:hypothetical protein
VRIVRCHTRRCRLEGIDGRSCNVGSDCDPRLQDPSDVVRAVQPIPVPTPWLDNSSVQVGPDSWDVFVASNYWFGPVGTSHVNAYQIWAGMTGDAAMPPGVPAVWVDILTIGSDGCSTSSREVGEFTDPGAGGTLTITSIHGSVVSLRSAHGRNLTFSLSSHRFATAAP